MKEDDPQQNGKFTTYCQVVSYLLSTYSKDDTIVDVEAGISNFKQPQGIFVVRYSEVLWEQAPRCGRAYHESHQKGVFIEVVHESIHLSTSTYWGAHKNVTLQNLS